MSVSAVLSAEFSLTAAQAEAVVALIDGGATVPFIARYRKEATGGLDDATLRKLDSRLVYLRTLEARKAEVLRLIDALGKLTPQLQARIEAAEVLQRVEDLYKPYRQRRATRASKARERGLEPLAALMTAQSAATGRPEDFARVYVNTEAGVPDAAAALAGACDIIAEDIADDADIIGILRERAHKAALLCAEAADREERTVYDNYYGYREPALRAPNHRVLAINRGEREKKLRVKAAPDERAEAGLTAWLQDRVIRRPSIFEGLLRDTAADAYRRLIAPALERELRAELTGRAETAAISVFAQNLEGLLMTPPVRGARVLAIDPGYRTGCKVAVLNEHGKLLDYTTVYPTKPRGDVDGTERVLKSLTEKHRVSVIAIGNGTAGRETEEVVAGFIARCAPGIRATVVNEAGASVYSASELADMECPGLDVTTRGAMSLGRRLQDPLAELVKIPPKSIGVGQYQHDLNQSALDKQLADTVERAVNRVGVDLNTASPSLLSYVSGVNAAVAKNIVACRDEQGGFTDRRQLKKVPKLGPKAFEQCAGFLRIADGAEPLDATSVHPESYPAAKALLAGLGVALVNGGVPDIETLVAEKHPNLRVLAEALGIGLPTLRDIIAEIKKPARDPRDDAPPVVWGRGVRELDDLRPGMELTGVVRNITDFGAFVDIGVKRDGLVHISKMASRFIRHPSEAASLGETVRVWVTDVDREKGRVGLSMVEGRQEG